MNHYYTLDLELWQDSDEARAEAEKIFDFEPKDLLEEAFVAYIQNLVQENTNLFHRFIFKVNA
jgi:hypothetical protein